jgi:hypothetical protein
MFSELLLHNTRQKIEAICGGLALCSLTLAAAWAGGIDTHTPAILLDDVFFGHRLPLLPGYFLAEAVVMLAVVYLLPRRPRLAMGTGLASSSVLLVETLFDLRTYAHDAHLLLEELAFAAMYAALLLLLAVYSFIPVAPARLNEITPLANPTPNPALAMNASAHPR